MFTLVFAARKGGVGKTTLTSTFAYIAYQRALRAAEPGRTPLVTAIDLDHQGCATRFFNARGGKPGPDLIEATLGTLPVILDELRELGYVAVFVDCPPAHGAVVAAAMRSATAVVIPAKSSELDLEATALTIKMAVAAGVPYWVLLNDGTFRTRAVGAAKTALEDMGVPLLPIVHRRVDIPLAGGETAIERAPESTAAKELMKAYDALEAMLCLPI